MEQDHLSEKLIQEVAVRIIARLATAPYIFPQSLDGVLPPAHSAAVRWLHSKRYIDGRGLSTYLTPEGWEYWKELQLGTTLYWLDKNWFPATVAAATFLVGIGTILAQVLD